MTAHFGWSGGLGKSTMYHFVELNFSYCLLLQFSLTSISQLYAVLQQTETFVCLKTHLLAFSLVRHISND